MTFCCRPSKNCFHCRQRRIKCDRVKPACSQCKRAGKECVGYREESALLFRDENARIIRRAVAAKERSRLKDQETVQQQKCSPSTVSLLLEGLASNANVISRPLSLISTDIDTLGLRFFFHHFATIPWINGKLQHSNKRSHFFETVDIDFSFRNAVVSVGLAALSNVKRDHALLILARQRYGIAIRAVRKVVQNPSESELNDSVRMIIMIAIFEIVDAKPGALNSWTVHISGICALVKRFPISQQLQLSTQAELWFYFGVITRYFQVGGLFPPELDLCSMQRKALAPTDTWPAFDLIDILVRFIRLCATLPYRREAEAEDILREAIIYGAELHDWENCLPTEWSVVTEEALEMPGTFYGKYHVYQDSWAARVLNHYRLGRLLVNEVILKYTGQLGDPMPEWLEQRQQSLNIVNEMATEICTGAASQALFADRGAVPSVTLPSPLIKGTFMMIYPLAVAATATGVSDRVRDWVVQTLQTVGHTTGIRQAVEIIPQLQRAGAAGKEILGWLQ